MVAIPVSSHPKTDWHSFLKEMRKGPEVFGKIARERYFMKADNEDIFVLSTDLPGSVEIDENEEDKDSIR